MPDHLKLAAGTGATVTVDACQVCNGQDLSRALFLGYLPPVNQMRVIGQVPDEQPAYPAQLLVCAKCQLVQLGLVVDKSILFPPEYPYSSGTTKILRDNFAALYAECKTLVKLGADDLIVDIGSNDGTLLSNFRNGGHKVRGIEPTLMGELANKRGISTLVSFFDRAAAERTVTEYGKSAIVTATNVFAHIEDVHNILDSILHLLRDDGLFVSESHYLISLIETLQYDTIYHEHLRYYSLHSLRYLLGMHGLEIVHARRIPTHGGSIRVYAARKGTHAVQPSVVEVLQTEEKAGYGEAALRQFRERMVRSKLLLLALLNDIKLAGGRIFGVGAPSRASTLINYVGLDDGILDCVLEVKDSHKVGKYMPGTLIPVLDEQKLFVEQPEYALLLSWHIADELIPKLRAKGYKGDFIVPLPVPRVIRSEKI